MRLAARMGGGLVAGVGLCALAFACGKGTTSPTVPPTATNIITIMPGGAVSPKSIAVPRGSQVTFVNNDSHPHDMQSNPHPEHDDCPELKQVGYLEVGERRESGNLNDPRTCGYHDNQNEGSAALRGTIMIQ